MPRHMNIVLRLLSSIVLVAGLALVGCGGTEDGLDQSDDALMRGLNAKGDSCDITLPGGTKEPGTENDKGECCSTLHPNDPCVVILKPFPTAYQVRSRR